MKEVEPTTPETNEEVKEEETEEVEENTEEALLSPLWNPRVSIRVSELDSYIQNKAKTAVADEVDKQMKTKEHKSEPLSIYEINTKLFGNLLKDKPAKKTYSILQYYIPKTTYEVLQSVRSKERDCICDLCMAKAYGVKVYKNL